MVDTLQHGVDLASDEFSFDHFQSQAMTAQQLPVGDKLKQLQDRLLELGSRLMRETDAEATALISKALSAVQNQRLSVSIVGQVSAGKTTLVNALARQPDLLPVSQSPWTAVVTRLHFGLHGFPESSSHFQFFDEAEWERLAEQGGRLRELAERFLPGFNSEQLQDQVKAMRHRAQARLGPAFRELLGSAHTFPSLEPQRVAQYVSSGPIPQSTADDEAHPAHYADITRSADLFFALEPFGYPLTLIDTPGTNDPFLVREEMTLRCLDSSDACIVVIDATKGVTDADLGLFRILRGVNTQRLILFVNKVDLLPSSPEPVIEAISAAIARELGSSEIPVIAGSARRSADVVPRHDSGWNSGLTDLEEALSDLVHHGHTAHYVHQAAATLTTLADGVRSQAAAQLTKLNKERKSDKASFDDQVRRARALAFAQEISDQIARTTGAAIASLKQIGVMYEKQALENLQSLIESFAASKKEEFLKLYPNKIPTKTVRFDTQALRQHILTQHTQDYRRIRREMTNSLRLATAKLMFLLNQAESDVEFNLDFDSVSKDFVYPSQAPLGQALAIDLDEPFWRRWWGRRVTTQEAAESLEALILQEFAPIIPELVRLSKGELDGEIDYSVLQLSISSTNLIQSLKNEQVSISATGVVGTSGAEAEPATTLNLAEGNQPVVSPANQPPDLPHWQYHFEIARSRHQRGDLLVRELTSLTNECQSLVR